MQEAPNADKCGKKKTSEKRDVTQAFQSIVAAPGFRIGIRCTDTEILTLQYLESGPESPPQNALAAETARQLRAYFLDPEFIFDLPLHPSGTAFQRRVWQEIGQTPCHRTRTYGELAKALRNAPRAVGQACAANPFPPVVPCHRIIAANGGIGGFAHQRGGFLLDVKRWLLSHEGCPVAFP